jgi:tRNA A-37 threonylcarbamoyl transferase component Bud32
MPLLDDIEAVMAAGTMLKAGGSSTVVLVQWQGRPLVIKRYNIKGMGHFLRRCLRPSRASHSWRQGHLWRVLELPTARPVAVLEKRWGPLRVGGYLIAEYSSEQDIIGAFNGIHSDALINQLQLLLERMADYQISHGDLKGTNVLIEEEKISFIDLDAAKLHVKSNRWSKAFKKDLSRLERNWPVTSSCYNAMTAMVSSVKRRMD